MPAADGDTIETSASIIFSSRSRASRLCTADALKLTCSPSSCAVSLLFFEPAAEALCHIRLVPAFFARFTAEYKLKQPH